MARAGATGAGLRRAAVRRGRQAAGVDGRWATVEEVGMMETGVGRFRGPSMAALLVEMWPR
jgi:hypothetical protein